jgi:hypothetical protein
MATTHKKQGPDDVNEIAFRVFQESVGEAPQSTEKVKNQAAVELGRMGGMVEGNSIRSTVRITGVAKNTVVKLLVDIGGACAFHHDKLIRNVTSKRVQCDEIWSFVGCKEGNLPEERKSGRAEERVRARRCLDVDGD